MIQHEPTTERIPEIAGASVMITLCVDGMMALKCMNMKCCCGVVKIELLRYWSDEAEWLSSWRVAMW